MKLQFRIAILGIIAILALLIGPVTVALQSQAQIEIVGNMDDHLTLTAPSKVQNWNLQLGSNDVQATLTVNSNNNWGVNAKSDQSDGKMKEFYSNEYISGGNSLHNPLHILCTSPVSTDISLTDQNQPLIPSGQTSIGSDTTCSMEFHQDITAQDTRATAPNRYHIQVIFTGFILY